MKSMKRFLAIYLGSEAALQRSGWTKLDEGARKQRERTGMDAWMKWGADRASSIVDQGTPIGKTKRVDASGISDVKNAIAGYVVVEAESHEAAAKLFANHPHFTIFPGEGVEVMECLNLAEVLAKRK
jgi:hypothetical protein